MSKSFIQEVTTNLIKLTVQRVYKLCTAIDYWLLDKKLAQSDDVKIFNR